MAEVPSSCFQTSWYMWLPVWVDRSGHIGGVSWALSALHQPDLKGWDQNQH